MLVVLLLAAIALAGKSAKAKKSDQSVGNAVMCESCHAVIHQASLHMKKVGRSRVCEALTHQGQVSAFLNDVCNQEKLRVYRLTPPVLLRVHSC